MESSGGYDGSRGPGGCQLTGIVELIYLEHYSYLPHPQPLYQVQGTIWPHYYKPAAYNEKAGKVLFDQKLSALPGVLDPADCMSKETADVLSVCLQRTLSLQTLRTISPRKHSGLCIFSMFAEDSQNPQM